jgi:proton-dependent oligopeptide transporter, POT family
VLVSITCLEFSYTQAPGKMKSVVMSLFLLSISAGNAFTSAVNYFILKKDGTSRLSGEEYFLFFAGVMLVISILFIFAAKNYKGKTYIHEEVKSIV